MHGAHQLVPARPGQLCYLAAQSTRAPGCGILAVGATSLLIRLLIVVLLFIVVVWRRQAQRMAAAGAAPRPLALRIFGLVSCAIQHSTSCTMYQADLHGKDMQALAVCHPEP